VVTAKKEIGRLWEQNGTIYGQIFPASLSGLRACRLVRIYRLVDRILADSERSEEAYYRRMFFRHGRYFVMAFLAHRLPEVVQRPQLVISADDERTISQQLGEHCHTHIIPRIVKVVDGTDKGGVTEAVGWYGGGGFRYFRLAPSLLVKDKWGREVISEAYNPEMLAEALCKIEGFTYSPSDSVYWQQGNFTERDFIYVTTQTLGVEQLQQLSDEVGPDRSLLVLCSAFRGKADRWPNLTVKKIPNHIRSRCEWGHDDYSLNVENLPKAAPKPEPETTLTARAGVEQRDLFGVVKAGRR